MYLVPQRQANLRVTPKAIIYVSTSAYAEISGHQESDVFHCYYIGVVWFEFLSSNVSNLSY